MKKGYCMKNDQKDRVYTKFNSNLQVHTFRKVQ